MKFLEPRLKGAVNRGVEGGDLIELATRHRLRTPSKGQHAFYLHIFRALDRGTTNHLFFHVKRRRVRLRLEPVHTCIDVEP